MTDVAGWVKAFLFYTLALIWIAFIASMLVYGAWFYLMTKP